MDLAKRLQRFQRVLVLKGRQLGLSWIAAAYALWVALTERGALVLLLSQTKDDALELLAKVQFVYDHLPEWLKQGDALPRTQILKFPALRSAVVALPSTKRAGRGRTARLVIADEHATHTWAVHNFAAVSPTIDAGGQFISISTANGIGNLYASLCAKAAAVTGWITPARRSDGHFSFGRRLRDVILSRDAWLPLFIPYSARPGRDEQWWEEKKDSYPQEWMVHQEYPRDPEEAFVRTGRSVFLKEVLDKHKDWYTDPLPREKWPRPCAEWSAEELRIWAPPVPGRRYIAGADVAEGLEHGDYSSLDVLDAESHETVLTLHGHWPPDDFAVHIDAIARIYRGVYGVERNNHGHAVLVTLKALKTPGIYRSRPVLTPKGVVAEEGRLGWLTDSTTKPLMIDELAEALRKFGIILRDKLKHAELSYFQTDAQGRAGAPEGHFDDRVISLAIAWQMRKHLPAPIEDDGRPVSTSTFAPQRW